ncbi:type IV pilus biogenesis protein PilM [Halanaerobaculum tunisiense]
MLSWFKPKLPLGVNLGEQQLKIVELLPAEPVPKLRKYLLEKIKPDLADQLATIKEKSNFRTNQVVVGIHGSQLVIRKINLPAHLRDNLAEVINWQADDYLPVTPEEVVLDYEVLDCQEELTVMLVAANREVIFEQIELLAQAGFQVVSVAASPLVLSRLVGEEKLTSRHLAILNLEATVAELVIFNRGEFSFRRYFNVKRSKLIKQAKKEGDFSRFNLQLERSLDYQGDLSSLLVTGGTDLQKLVEVLDDKLELEVGLFNLMPQIQFAPQDMAPQLVQAKLPQLAISLGLALRGRVDND